MNVTQQHKTRTFTAFVMPSPSEGSLVSGWKGYALRVAALAVGFGVYVLLFRKKDTSDRGWSPRRSPRTPTIDADDSNAEVKEQLSDERSLVTYNCEVCPICLGAPKIGVKAPCGHLLCADCLASYCDIGIAPAPPPCPLCRAPLNSVALVSDFTAQSPKVLDPNTVMVLEWIRQYNDHRGLMTSGHAFLTTRLLLLFNILIFTLIAGLIATKLQVLAKKSCLRETHERIT